MPCQLYLELDKLLNIVGSKYRNKIEAKKKLKE